MTMRDSGPALATFLPLGSRRVRAADPRLVACAAGVVSGTLASVLRLGPGAIGGLAGGIAVWATIDFLVARTARTRSRAMAAGVIYLALWLASYYVAQRVLVSGTSTRVLGAAVPWLVLLIPGGCLLGLVAEASTQRDRIGDVCLVLPLAWSVPEALREVRQGPAFVAEAVVTILIAAVPLVLERRRSVDPITAVAGFAVCAVALGVLEELVKGARVLGGV